MKALRKLSAVGVIVGFGVFGMLGGCELVADEDDPCDLRSGACVNNCNKAGLGFSCRMCCRNKRSECQKGTNANFGSCLN